MEVFMPDVLVTTDALIIISVCCVTLTMTAVFLTACLISGLIASFSVEIPRPAPVPRTEVQPDSCHIEYETPNWASPCI